MDRFGSPSSPTETDEDLCAAGGHIYAGDDSGRGRCYCGKVDYPRRIVHQIVEVTATEVTAKCGVTERRQTPLQPAFTVFASRVTCEACKPPRGLPWP